MQFRSLANLKRFIKSSGCVSTAIPLILLSCSSRTDSYANPAGEVQGLILSPGTERLYTLSVTNQDFYTFDVLNPVSDVEWRLEPLIPTFDKLTNADGAILLLNPGDYQVRLRGGQFPGPYRFALRK